MADPITMTTSQEFTLGLYELDDNANEYDPLAVPVITKSDPNNTVVLIPSSNYYEVIVRANGSNRTGHVTVHGAADGLPVALAEIDVILDPAGKNLATECGFNASAPVTITR